MSTYLSLLAAAFSLYYLQWRQRSKQYPPGPQRLPLIGSMLSMPAKLDAETFEELGSKYGAY
jgi:hypothetical protein